MKLKSDSNYARGAVPLSERKPTLALISFLSGLYNTLPVYALASAVILGLGLVQGAIAIAAGMTIAVILSSVTAHIGGTTGLTTYNINIHTFGRRGSVLVNFIINIGAIGWYGLTLGFFAMALDAAMRFAFGVEIPLPVYTVLAGVGTTFTVLYGFNAMDGLNRVAIPLLALFLAWVAYETINTTSLEQVWSFTGAPDALPGGPDANVTTFLAGVTATVGLASASASGMPDVMRFARSGRSAITAIIVTLLVSAPIFMTFSALPVIITGEGDFIANLLSLELGLAAVVIVILATWTTNIVNVYAGSLSMARLIPTLKDVHATLICGVLGVAIALSGITNHFLTFFLLLGVTFPPIAGVYIAHYFLEWRRAGGEFRIEQIEALNIRAIIAWIAGSGVAYATQFTGFLTLTNVSAVDGVVVAGLVFTQLFLLSKQRSAAGSPQAKP